MACDPAELISDANLIDCCIPKGMQMSVLISLFCQLNDMSCDAPTLLEEARCIDQCIPDGAKMSVLISLACQLVETGGGGGGAQQVFCGHAGGVMPVTPIPDPSVSCAVFYDLDSPFDIWKWDSVALNWGA